MIITIDTTQPVTEADKVILLALAGQISLGDEAQAPQAVAETLSTSPAPAATNPVTAMFGEPAEEPVTAVQAGAEEAPAAESKPSRRSRCKICGELHFGGTNGHEEAPAAAEEQGEDAPETPDEPETEVPVTAAVPEPAPEQEESASEAPAPDADSLRAEAVKVATAMVAAGKAADVRKVLNEIGVRRVSEIADGDLQRFLDAVSA